MPGTKLWSSKGVRAMDDGWFHTWPERSYDRLEGVTPQDSPAHRTAVPLSSLLSHMSLAYSPITKGLHVLQPTSDVDTCDEENQDATDESLSEKSSPKIIVDKPGRDLVLQSCFKSINKLGDVENDQWISKIGYEEGNTSDFIPQFSVEPAKGSKTEIDQGTPCLKPDGKSLGDTEECTMRTQMSSFSSIVSSLSDASPSHAEENLSVRLDEDDRSQKSIDCNEQSKFFDGNSPKVTKKKGLSGFFSKNVFTWKGSNNSSNAGGETATWKFLGKSFASSTPPSESLSSHVPDSSLRGSSQSINDNGSQRYGDVVASSSALILHERPASLPAKSEDERVKHRQQYQGIVEAAKRKEEKDSKQRIKSLQKQLKHEEQLANAVRIWNCEILPKWGEMKSHRRTRELWWAGLPPCVRGKVWLLAVENDLNITHHLYHICATRAEERLKCAAERGDDTQDEVDGCDKESSMQLIQLDIARTFPQLCIFQKGGPYYDILHSVLGAYVCYRPDVGYVQGMSFLAAILILNLDPADAFICFANILNKPCLHAFFTLSQAIVEVYYDIFNSLLKENLPKLHSHLKHSGLTPDLYLLDWVYSVFGKAVSLDIACRIWDVFLRDGEEFLFQTALGILHLYESELLELDFVHGAQLLTRLPDSLSADQLFKSIASIKLTVGKLTFSQLLVQHLPR